MLQRIDDRMMLLDAVALQLRQPPQVPIELWCCFHGQRRGWRFSFAVNLSVIRRDVTPRGKQASTGEATSIPDAVQTVSCVPLILTG
jgi:hypothetical protein